MNQPILKLLQGGRRLLADGAMGTELQRRGFPSTSCPEEANLTHPELVQAIYSDYYAAGSDFVETNTFGGNRSRLALHALSHRGSEICRRSAELAREVCPPGRFVAGSIGPSGDILQPLGPRSPDEAYEIFAEQARALAEGGVDLLIVETMMAVEEAEIAVRAAKETTGLPVAATMTFELGKAGLRTVWGVDVKTAVDRLSQAGADILGANCGRGFEEMIAIVEEMRPLTSKPILAQPNAGLPKWVDGLPEYSETSESIRPKVDRLLDLGANIIGGCCGTRPAHIRSMREQLDARGK